MDKKEIIPFTDFNKIDMRIGEILTAEHIAGTEKLYKLNVAVGFDSPIQIVTGLVPYYTESELTGKKIVVVVNLKPVKFKGEESQGMLLCAVDKEKDECVLLSCEKDISAGTPIS